jgi:hypothetical protein
MGEQTFLSLKFSDMGRLANGARSRVVLGAPGIDQGLAAALVNAFKRLGEASVTVLLDVAEDNCRVGYGECEGYAILVEGGVPVRICAGLRVREGVLGNGSRAHRQCPLAAFDRGTRRWRQVGVSL